MDPHVAEPRWRFSLRDLFVLTGIIGGLLAMIVPALRFGRDAVRQHQCVMNLKVIAIGLENYHSVFQSLPPSRYVGEDQKVVHSFRVLLLPYLESGNFYSNYQFAQVWNSPANTALATNYGWGDSYAWACPSSFYTENLLTNYIAVTGPHTIFPEDNVGLKFNDIPDGTSNTLLVGEMDPPTIHWLEPRDLEFAKLPLQINARSRPCLSSRHRSGINVAMADGSVRYLPTAIESSELRSLLLIDDAADPRDDQGH